MTSIIITLMILTAIMVTIFTLHYDFKMIKLMRSYPVN